MKADLNLKSLKESFHLKLALVYIFWKVCPGVSDTGSLREGRVPVGAVTLLVRNSVPLVCLTVSGGVWGWKIWPHTLAEAQFIFPWINTSN